MPIAGGRTVDTLGKWNLPGGSATLHTVVDAESPRHAHSGRACSILVLTCHYPESTLSPFAVVNICLKMELSMQ